MSNHPSMYWQLSHLSTPLYTFHITITPLHKTFLIHFTPPWWLSHSLTTVTPPQADVHLLHDHHNCPSSDTPVFTFHTSLRTVTPPDNCLTFPHSLTPPPWSWPSHLSINWHACLIPFTPPWWLLHFLKPSDTPYALLLPMTITPPH